MTDGEAQDRLERLEADIKEHRQKPKDWWDKLSSVSGFLSGAIIGGIGLYATATYNARQLDAQNLQKSRELIVQRVQTVERFFPHLSSDKQNVRRAALEAIAVLGDESLAVKLASHFGGEGGTAVLAKLSTSNDPVIAQGAAQALAAQFARLRSSVAVVRSGPPPGVQATAFFISSDGLALAPSFAIVADPVTIELQSGGPAHPAAVIMRDDSIHLVLLRAKLDRPVVPLAEWNVDARPGSQAFVLAFAKGDRWVSKAGVIVALTGAAASMRLATSIESEPGFAGAPVVDEAGRVLGMAESRDASGRSLVIPASVVRQFTEKAGRLTGR